MSRGVLESLLRHPFLFNLMRTYVSGDFAPVSGDLAGRPGWKILDLACGTAFYARELWGERDVFYCGIDNTPQYIEYAAGKFDAGRFIVGDALRLLFPDGTFDLVASLGFLHHIPDGEVPPVVEGVRRVLKRGGLFVVAEPVLFFRFLRYLLVPRKVMMKLDRGQYVREPGRYASFFSSGFSLERKYPFRNGPHDWWAFIYRKA